MPDYYFATERLGFMIVSPSRAMAGMRRQERRQALGAGPMRCSGKSQALPNAFPVPTRVAPALDAFSEGLAQARGARCSRFDLGGVAVRMVVTTMRWAITCERPVAMPHCSACFHRVDAASHISARLTVLVSIGGWTWSKNIRSGSCSMTTSHPFCGRVPSVRGPGVAKLATVFGRRT